MTTKSVKDVYNMDGHKLLWHLDRVSDFVKGNRIAPLHIDMGLTTGCNMNCTYCYGVIQGRTAVSDRFDMNEKVLRRFLREAKAAGVRSIAFIGEGENTLNPALYDAIDEANKVDIDVSLATNGVLTTPDRAESLVNGLKWIRVNISAATAEAFEKIHKVKQFDRVCKNIQGLVAKKKELKSGIVIGTQMVVVKENYDQIVPLARLSQELGVDYFVIKSCSDTYDHFLNSPNEDYLTIDNVLKEAESFSTEKFTVSVKWNKLRNAGHKDYKTCYGTQFILAISGDGSVFPCGHWFNVRRDEFVMGNIIEESFLDILSSNRYWGVQEKIQTVNVNKDCESNCRQHYCNQFLSTIKTDPVHVNFI